MMPHETRNDVEGRYRARIATLESEAAELREKVAGLTAALAEADKHAEKIEALLDPHIAWEGQPPKAYADILARAEATEAALKEAVRLLERVPGALNGAFAAGTEEREGGSARRQERYSAPGDALRREIPAFLSQHSGASNAE